MAADGDLERFAHESEDDGVFTDIVADAKGVIANFVAGACSRATMSAVNVIRLPHFFGDNLAEAEGGATGGVFLEAMVAFDDFDIDAIGDTPQHLGRLADEIHGDVHREAHAGGDEHGGLLGGGQHAVLEFAFEPGGGDHEGNLPLGARLGDLGRSGGDREIDHDIDAVVEGGGERDAIAADARQFPRVLPEQLGLGGFERRLQSELGVAVREGNQPLAHPAAGAVDGEGKGLFAHGNCKREETGGSRTTCEVPAGVGLRDAIVSKPVEPGSLRWAQRGPPPEGPARHDRESKLWRG